MIFAAEPKVFLRGFLPRKPEPFFVSLQFEIILEVLNPDRSSSRRAAGDLRGRLLHRVRAPPAPGGPGRAGGVPAGGAGGAARAQGEAASRLRSGSGPTAGTQGPPAAHHAEGASPRRNSHSQSEESVVC